MLDISAGTIKIDSVDISTVSRQDVRTNLVTLPQEPFFVRGSVRQNLDPLKDSTDEQISQALRSIGMWDLFSACGGLDAMFNAEKMSQGQRQLFCLVRAMIKSGRIVVLDEAMSSVDATTEALMQDILCHQTQGRTIIAVVHRLHTILDYDRVMILDNGRLIESGRPMELLATANSTFRSLYESLHEADADGSALSNC
jgi:ATP-binding cassette, subfamily C (CFTR/MRP), member 1